MQCKHGWGHLYFSENIINSLECHHNVYVGKERVLCFWFAMLAVPSFDAVAMVVMTTQP